MSSGLVIGKTDMVPPVCIPFLIKVLWELDQPLAPGSLGFWIAKANVGLLKSNLQVNIFKLQLGSIH